MRIVPEITAGRRTLGLCVMTIVPLLQIATEYLGTDDRGRAISKLAVTIIGLPILIKGSSAGLRWAAGRRSGPLVLLVGGMLSAGTLYAALLYAMHLASPSLAVLPPQGTAWTGTAAELARLRSHLEPHFLLNTLNAIAGLVTEDPRAARRLLASLGDLLRHSLRDEGEMQTLGEQIDWLRHYAQILEQRHAGHLAFRWEVGAGTRGALLPRLLLQPLVENAVKHGALGRKDGGTIEVRAALVDAKTLVCTVEDNGPGLPEGTARPGGFGLHSVRRRLALQYAERARLRLESSPSGTRSIVEIPIEEAPS